MSESPDPSSGSAPATAGGLLRAAREKQGLHIAALAAAIKVVPKKLELLEADRFDELPDATFARALAQTVCRALKIDPVPILQRLPPPLGHRLEHVSGGLNTPFRERPGALVLREPGDFLASPAFWIVSLLLLAALVVYVVPSRFLGLGDIASPQKAAQATVGEGQVGTATLPDSGAPTEGISDAGLTVLPASSPTMTAMSASAVLSGPVPGAVPDAAADAVPDVLAAPGTSMAALAAASGTARAQAMLPDAVGLLKLRPTTPSWVGVVDARGKSLLSRVVAAGETVGVDGEPPFKVTIGNAAGTEVVFRDQPVELPALKRDGVARLVLK